MATDEQDLQNFLQKVDEVDNIIKGLVTAKDDQKEAISKADEFLNKYGEDKNKNEQNKKHYPSKDKTGVNRTVINQKAFDEMSNAGPEIKQEMSQEAFMSAIEADAKQRAQRKSRLKKEATLIKDKGNEEYKNGNYEKAIEFYTEALSKIKDYSALWTNRAQAYIKLGQFEKALDDCEWALKVSDTCLKAYIHKGKALAGLHQYDEALDCFRRATEIEPGKEKAIMEYVREVELQKKASEEEKLAQESFDAGDFEAKGIVEILEKLNKSDQLPYYYSGGLQLVKQIMKDTKERTLFRTSGGLQLTETHPYISKCMAASARSLSKEELDLCAAVLETYVAACTDNEENQRVILELEKLPEQILKFLESKWKLTNAVKEAALNLLFNLSLDEHCRIRIVSHFDMSRLMSCLFTLMKSKRHSVATTAVALLNNLALAKRFKIQLREKIADVLPAFENAMTDEDMSLLVLPSCISSVTNLCGDVIIRKQLQTREEIWKTCCSALEKYTVRLGENQIEEVLFALLGLLMNLTLERSDSLQQFAITMCQPCVTLLTCGKQRLEERSCGVLSHVLPHSVDAVNKACDTGIVPSLLNIIKNVDNPHLKSAMKTLTVCTQHSQVARETILNQEKGLKRVYDLLKHEDEQVLGNASLCLSHCATLPKVSAALAKTNVIMDLLVLTRDGNNTSVRHNCAILIAKLTQGHPRHLERLRELDGLGILHDVMKHVKE